MKRDAGKSGLTLIELVIALGLLALLMLLVIQVFDRALATWRTAETRRAVMEAASVATELVTDDLRGVEGGPRGDFLLEWVMYDTNSDGVRETKWPRLRLVRQASGGEVARIQRDMRLVAETKQAQNGGEVVKVEPASPSQLEVVWMIAPSSTSDKDARSVGILWRGERLVTDAGSKSFFAHDFFGASNLPPAGATQEVTGGLLWLNILLASQTTSVHDGWKLSHEQQGAATSWDAWSKDRPDASMHPWNERQAGVPVAKQRPVLPRRARVELEIERPIDRIRRTRTVDAIDNQTVTLRVDDGQSVPLEPDAHILLDAEWMKVVSVDGGRVVVERAQRGTTAVGHDKGTLVHFGLRMVTEVTIAAFREDWQL
jgi:type II secretory pathway pseudopilin PulG